MSETSFVFGKVCFDSFLVKRQNFRMCACERSIQVCGATGVWTVFVRQRYSKGEASDRFVLNTFSFGCSDVTFLKESCGNLID